MGVVRGVVMDVKSGVEGWAPRRVVAHVLADAKLLAVPAAFPPGRVCVCLRVRGCSFGTAGQTAHPILSSPPRRRRASVTKLNGLVVGALVAGGCGWVGEGHVPGPNEKVPSWGGGGGRRPGPGGARLVRKGCGGKEGWRVETAGCGHREATGELQSVRVCAR